MYASTERFAQSITKPDFEFGSVREMTFRLFERSSLMCQIIKINELLTNFVTLFLFWFLRWKCSCLFILWSVRIVEWIPDILIGGRVYTLYPIVVVCLYFCFNKDSVY